MISTWEQNITLSTFQRRTNKLDEFIVLSRSSSSNTHHFIPAHGAIFQRVVTMAKKPGLGLQASTEGTQQGLVRGSAKHQDMGNY